MSKNNPNAYHLALDLNPELAAPLRQSFPRGTLTKSIERFLLLAIQTDGGRGVVGRRLVDGDLVIVLKQLGA